MSDFTSLAAEDRAQEALLKSPISALRDLQVEQAGESLTISGRVSSFYYKQLAQELVRSVASEVQVVNELTVD